MALLDRLYNKAGAWLWVNTELMPHCDECASGRRAYSAGGFLLSKVYHKRDGRIISCRSPWHWRGCIAKGHTLDEKPSS